MASGCAINDQRQHGCKTCANSKVNNGTGRWCIYSPAKVNYTEGDPICEGDGTFSMWAPITPTEDPTIGFDPEPYTRPAEVLSEEKPYMGFVLEDAA